MDAELINHIVQQVVAAMRQSGQLPAAADAAPAGTGDGKLPAAAGVSAQAPANGRPLPPQAQEMKNSKPAIPASPARVFITAELLEQRLKGAAHGNVLELAHNEFLTPNARDIVIMRHLTVRQAAKPAGVAPSVLPRQAAAKSAAQAEAHPAASGPIAAVKAAGDAATPVSLSTLGLVLDRPDQKVQTAVAAVGHKGIAFVDYTQTDCAVRNTRALCQAIGGGAVAAGVIILPHAADAMVLVNKARGVRAVQGTTLQAVQAGVRHFAANLLVLEHAATTFHQMRTMIEAFATDRPAAPVARTLMDAIAELERA